MSPILTISDLAVFVDSKEVISGLSLTIEAGQVVAVGGRNGSGKSSLAMTLLGSEQYSVSRGKISFSDNNMLEMTVDARSRAGLYVAWQNPITIPGVSVFALCKAECECRGVKIESMVEFKNKLEELAIRVGLSKEHIARNVNEGFSGGERKRLELLQILLLKPKLVILDEIDSGLDVHGRELIVSVIEELRQNGSSVVVISHYEQLLKEIKVDAAWEMKDGRLYARIS